MQPKENLSKEAGVAFPVDTLLAWYDASHRKLPWRAPPGELADPYRVWLSEIMLQQTTVKAVAPYYAAFLQQWPTVEALAAADRDDVLKAWAGLGYYARARNLHACAQHVTQHYGGRFPDTVEGLLKLPGVGPYTAAAVAAIAFGKQAAVVDGNVERVLARYFAVETPLPDAKKELRALAEEIAPVHRPGDYAQAMMDLGATVCAPRTPSCMLCPISADCAGRAKGLEAVLPYKAAKQEKPTRRGAAFFASRWDGAVLLRTRADKGLLGGMVEVPGTPWAEGIECAEEDTFDHAPVSATWARVPGEVLHTFTHFHLELAVFRANVPPDAEIHAGARPENCMWVPREELRGQALPSVMRKVVTHALDGRVD